MTVPFVERRRVPRSIDPKARAKVIAGHNSSVCPIYNVSVGGVAIRNVGLGLSRGVRVELRFMIPLFDGTTKIHLRHATVVYTTKGVTGFAIDTVPFIAPNTQSPA